MKKLLYVCEIDSGGIMDYAILQCEALSKVGISISFLCKPSFPKDRFSPAVKIIELAPVKAPDWAFGKLKTIWLMTLGLSHYSRQIRKIAEEENFKFILFAFYKEYFSPFWIRPLKQLQKNGCVMGTISHDPVRDFVIGPKWWHRFCVRKAFSFLTHVFVHDDTPVDFGGGRPGGVCLHQIPFASYPLLPSRFGREKIRLDLGFGPSDIVFFAFGQIRDGKNLDLFLRAMTKLPENVKLLVAGKGHSGSSRPPEFYQNLAEELGVAERCRFEIRQIPDEEVGELFNAIDFTLLTYSVKFRSMSAVLATALTARKPVLASSGSGPLKSTVEKYHLGVFVDPDNLEEVLRGARQLIDKFSPHCSTGSSTIQTVSSSPAWSRYEHENSWDQNARIVHEAFF
jgi:glycosyltransferase involved in cell wall biosynthesis